MLTDKLAKIDLDTGRIDLDPIADATLRGYLGGRGLNMRLLFPWLKKAGHSFDPRSPIVLSPGLLCGIPSLGSRMSISARSPETGYLGDANMGGELGAEMKTSGINALFITGRSRRPAYLLSSLSGRSPIGKVSETCLPKGRLPAIHWAMGPKNSC